MSNEIKNNIVLKLRFPEFEDCGEWDFKTMEEVAPLQRGFDLPAEQIKVGTIPVVYSNGVRNFHNVGMAKAPGLVTGRSGTIGQIHFIAEGDYWPHNTSLWVTSFKNNSPKFIYFLYKSIGLNRFASGSGVPTLNRNDVHVFQVYLPSSLKEQQKIASCLSSLDELITSQSEKLEALKAHKKGLMQQLFPAEGETVPKLRFPEFKDSGEWKEKVLGEISDVRDGTHDSPKFVLEGKPLLTSKNLLSTGQLDFQNTSLISQIDYEQINKRSKVDVGDILFGMIGTIGNPVMVKIDGFAIKNVALIKQKKELLNTYLIHFLNSDYINSKFSFLLKGNAQKFIALGVIRNINICIPNLSEQQKIASCLSSLDELITAQAEKIEALKEHKKGLMQGLFPSEL